ncbi:MAG: hypothetical protein WBN82_08025 [Porticoccaceae bacterium]
MAFDGTARLNQDLIAALSLPDTLVQEDIAQTREIAQTRKRWHTA